MRERIKSFFSGEKTVTPEIINTLDSQKTEPNAKSDSEAEFREKDKKSSDTYVFIWEKTTSDPGHAAIQVGGEKPKLKVDEPGNYVSIHPKGFPSMGPTAVLPLPAHLTTSLEEDMDLAAQSRNKDPILTSFDEVPIISQDAPTIPAPPDHVYKFQGLDSDLMNKEITKLRDNVEQGKTNYQLLPNVSLLGFFSDASSFVSQDPLDVMAYHRQRGNKKYEAQVTNCSTLVTHILNQGGANLSSPNKPWGVSPDGLAKEIASTDGLAEEIRLS
ncbi:hypothetical protein [Legionella micdadei]|uniref:Uncharacterized protein n=1 Tax=Legionella micdadei TaxID=451 RepID=A0A098GIZ8_LEGMI|nr:hypothetical protein [Legionella micdadei]ARG96645.1 hypothetical protein B6N58_02585 [Legionella micdadei]ARG99392.1 hypothetical protein B6V88_02580 [Legionella micdadei]KTD26308.1 hypothetical protein Lmic_2402 [Legionella micdadei]NSL19117.1 hypothetical protein [Legionella micdadei]CEG61982.1 protein of unknown function [Legionella micdadei]